MKHWWLNCPYCNTRIAEGVGEGKFPKVFVPFIRCKICGELISTNSKEYINFSVEERLKICATSTNCEYIEQSLDRTNNIKYINFLKFKHFDFYPINEQDYKRFKKVDFKKYEKALPSKIATKSLYNVGILIREEDLDKETGGFKKEKLLENQRNYEINKKANKAGILSGFIIGILFAIIFGHTDPKGYSSLWGILFGVVSYLIVAFLTQRRYEKELHNDKSKLKYEKMCDFSLCPKCGMQIFKDDEICPNCGYKKETSKNKNIDKDDVSLN